MIGFVVRTAANLYW